MYDQAVTARYFEPYEYVRHIEAQSEEQLDQEIQKILSADSETEIQVLEVEKVTEALRAQGEASPRRRDAR